MARYCFALVDYIEDYAKRGFMFAARPTDFTIIREY